MIKIFVPKNDVLTPARLLTPLPILLGVDEDPVLEFDFEDPEVNENTLVASIKNNSHTMNVPVVDGKITLPRRSLSPGLLNIAITRYHNSRKSQFWNVDPIKIIPDNSGYRMSDAFADVLVQFETITKRLTSLESEYMRIAKYLDDALI